jgi:hypothetical protein
MALASPSAAEMALALLFDDHQEKHDVSTCIFSILAF